jgi:maltooligosyltrehalose trehalohydrolase
MVPVNTARHFWSQFADEVRAAARAAGRTVYITAESSANDPRTVRSTSHGGFGNDAQWNDDFHNALHVVLTGESAEYYKDFSGVRDFATALRDGFVFQGQFSRYWNRQQGSRPTGIKADQLIVFAQNHDQIGNRREGDRLSAVVGFEQLTLAAAAVMFSPNIPMIFMGEEYGETAPFMFFIDHSDMQVIDAVRRGRPREWPEFFKIPGREPPNPYDEDTFLACKLNHALKGSGRNRALREFYRELIRMRRECPALREPSFGHTNVAVDGGAIVLRRWHGDAQAAIFLNFAQHELSLTPTLDGAGWRRTLDSSSSRWGGPSEDTNSKQHRGGAPVNLPPHAAIVLESSGSR